MLEDIVILPICERWSKILWKKGLEYDELMAIAYCIAKPLPPGTDEGTIAIWIKQTLLKYIYQTDLIKIKSHCNKEFYNENIKNFYQAYKRLRKDLNFQELEKASQVDAILDIQESIDGLSEDEAQIIYMRFWLGKTFTEIAKEFKRPQSWAFEQVNRIIGLLKNKVLR